MNWFNRKQKNINTPTAQKKELPDGMWYKTPGILLNNIINS